MRIMHIVMAGLIASTLACTPAERRDAADAAESAGATAEARIEDATVTAGVKAKLLADQTVSGMKIDVDTREGVVTLTGMVDTAAAKERATELARTTQGAVRVEDQLTVRAQ